EPERIEDQEELGGLRVLARLAGLGDDRLDDALAVLDQPAAHLAEYIGAAVEAERLPSRLRDARALRERGDLRGGEVRDVRDGVAGGGVLDGDGGSAPTVLRSLGFLLDGSHAENSKPARNPTP